MASEGRAPPLHPLRLCSCFFPPLGHTFARQPFWRRLPPSAKGPPQAHRLGPTHFLCPNSASTPGGKFLSSRWAAPSPSFPAGQESPKRVGRRAGFPGLQPERGSDSAAVIQPPDLDRPAWNAPQRSHRQASFTRVRAPPAGGVRRLTSQNGLPAPEPGSLSTRTLRKNLFT